MGNILCAVIGALAGYADIDLWEAGYNAALKDVAAKTKGMRK